MSVLPDLLEFDLKIVFCGTAAGEASARQVAYYAGKGNKFWPTLARVGLTPRQFLPEEYRELLGQQIGLTDLAKNVSGNDRVLPKNSFDRPRLTKLIAEYRPRILAFTSKYAASKFVGHRVDYGVLPVKEGESILFVLPSPSGAACRYWNEQTWQELARIKASLH